MQKDLIPQLLQIAGDLVIEADDSLALRTK
jgi:hypothetical protein